MHDNEGQENQLNLVQLEEEKVEEMLSQTVALLYKHSPTCSVSSLAYQEIKLFSQDHPEIPIYQINVLSQRSLSTQLAIDLDIRHESPQVILLLNGRPVWNTSHFSVRKGVLENKIKAI